MHELLLGNISGDNIMAVIRDRRPNLGSGAVKFIDGIPFDGLGSAGFGEDDLLIIGDDLDNLDLIGGSGHDEIDGGAGNDVLRGGAGNGILIGGDGNDDLDGQEGTEKLFGGNGDDILRAGGSKPANIPAPELADYDRLNGGAGSDTFGFYGLGSFEIADFTPGEDRLFFDTASIGIDHIEELLPYISRVIEPAGNNGYIVEFVGGAATIEFLNFNINALTADMIVFSL